MVKYARNHSVTETAIRYHVSRKTVYKWLSRYDGSVGSLEDRSHRPKSCPRSHTEKELRQIRRRLKKHKWSDLLLTYQELRERDGYQRSYDGYEIKKSYTADETDEWEPVFDASSGKNLLIVKLKVTNISGAPAVADVLSKDMMFSISGDNGISSMALVTMLLNDFASARDEIGAGESKQYVLITQVDESITETSSLSLLMKKGNERLNVKLQ